MIRSPKVLRFLERAGTWCVRGAVVGLFILFLPALYQESRYGLRVFRDEVQTGTSFFQSEAEQKAIKREAIAEPVQPAFSIVIPKIGANSQIVADVDWQDSRVYQQALTKGVAHAQGSAKPGERGNVFLFAHAGSDPLEALRYNAVFYLLDKLTTGDVFFVWYQQERFTYQVTHKKIVQADEVQYIKGSDDLERLTLMTCWPAGTTWKRLIVQAELIQREAGKQES